MAQDRLSLSSLVSEPLIKAGGVPLKSPLEETVGPGDLRARSTAAFAKKHTLLSRAWVGVPGGVLANFLIRVFERNG